MSTSLHDNREPERLLDQAVSVLRDRTATLAELLDRGEPDLPPAPRRPGGRHRADRGSIRLQTAVALFWIAVAAGCLVWLAAGRPGVDTTPLCERPVSTVACGETLPYPHPVPGAPPQAPHAGFPGSETLAPFIADTEETP